METEGRVVTDSSQKIKVLHLIDSGGLYGAEKVLLTLCDEQIKQGLSPTILSCGVPGEESKAIESEAERLGISCLAWRMKAGLNIKGMREIWQWIRSEGFTHLHSHGYKFNILLALTKSQDSGTRLITTLHGYTSTRLLSKAGIQQLFDRLILFRFDRICWVGAKNGISHWVKVVNCGRIRYVKNGVALGVSSEMKDSNRPLRLLMVGRLSEEKGVRYALEALWLLQEKGVSADLTLAGDGPLRSELYALARELNVLERVNFLGFVEDVYPLYGSHDLLLMPSLTEGLPLVMLEAVSLGLPVIASSVGAIPEVLQDDTLLIELPLSSKSLAAKINNWMQLAPTFRASLVKSLSNRIQQEYSAAAMAENYRSIYEELDAEI